MNLSLPPIDAFTPIITCNIEGILEINDLEIFTSRPPAEEKPAVEDLKNVKEKHHMAARMKAQGMSQTLIASLAGYTESYLSVLLNNPAMDELVAYYRAQVSNAADSIAEKLRSTSMRAVEKLSEKMDSDAGLSENALLGLAKLGLDRSGHGPSSTQHTINEQHVFDHAHLRELNNQALRGSREYIIKPEDMRPSLPAPAEDDEA